MKFSFLSTTAKILLLGFIAIAVYKGNQQHLKDFIQNIFYTKDEPTKIELKTNSKINNSHSLSAKSKNNQRKRVSSGEQSFISQKAADVFDHLMDNPQFYHLVENILKESSSKQGAIIENDPAFQPIIKSYLQFGKGPRAYCGDQVTIDFKIASSEDANNLHNLPKKTSTFFLGDRKNNIHLGVQNSIVNLQEKSLIKSIFFDDLLQRTALDLKYKKSSNAKVAEINLVKITKPYKPSNLIVHYTRNSPPGSLPPFCGELYSFSYKVLNINGKVLYDSKKNKKIQNLEINNTIPREVIQALLSAPIKNMGLTIIGTKKNILASFGNKNIFNLNKVNYSSNKLLVVNLQAITPDQPS
ncbi:MAG: hypothetical protein RLN62_01945 [Rickettsiales bacterium]